MNKKTDYYNFLSDLKFNEKKTDKKIQNTVNLLS